MFARKLLEVGIGAGQRSFRHVDEWRKRAASRRRRIGNVLGLHRARNLDVDLAVRLVDAEQMHDVAKGVELLRATAGSQQLPGEHPLPGLGAWSQP